MKKCYFFLLFTSFFSCTEISPVIPPLGDKKVLIEEFTGVRCVNCPAGASEIENLKATYGDRLIVISIHAGDFAPPYSDSKFDFRTTEGNELEKLLGSPIGYPSAIINRKRFSNQNALQIFRPTWAGFTANESSVPSPLSLGFVKNYDATTRKLDIEVKIIPTENLSGDIRLSLALTESGIKDQQETPNGKKADYTHKYILRKMLTKFDGDALSGLTKGSSLSKTFNFIVPANWQAENCRLVAFIHKSGSDKDVLQVNDVNLK
jgi:Outer membrane protein Omp28